MISDVYLYQVGGASAEQAALDPAENEAKYPDPEMFGEIPASGIFFRHIRNLEVSNVEIATDAADGRPAFWLRQIEGADLFRVRVPRPGSVPAFSLEDVKDFRHFGSQFVADLRSDHIENQKL